ncbi:valine--tRNA ligase [Candidatus Magnetominusculus xianensis]|uniref:Valine--tRNA ligase n=1 Tax=Candidatus Magnetominusculus xianensis TaxID=1748249 RepID=A0ABR5SMC0_9BACT|nr:valine--tRNA ligase [Candidatus Magnetominusculus xianensis]KWT92709.1 valine--tRNA ligase [Candidatus Magnetominusculus xianensis]MBF0403740.1 valine--tRNA ligase [Nitrospirota bacterium]
MNTQVKEIAKSYEPKDVEEKWYSYWMENGFFQPSPGKLNGKLNDKSKQSYSIVIPPPNVTGSLHMGHALNVTLQDILSRWKRMKGYTVLWVPGTDHAGIATQNVVEKQLAAEGLSREALGRAAFTERVWQWKALNGGQIIHQLKKLGASCDWSRERFTLDEGLSRAVREVFVSLFEDGLIYRSTRLINWCPRCSTALSDLEAEHEEYEGKLTYIRYPLLDEHNYIIVATTRPETMLGDTAVAVNPDDERYNGYIGKLLRLPLAGRTIPIIADKEVDPSFGTGAVKVTPAHDFNDEAIAKRQSPHLPFIAVIGQDGKMTENAGDKYAGLDRYDCRKAVIEDLKEKGLLIKEDKHTHSIAHCYRCRTIIEPLPTAQWYVDVESMAKDAIDLVSGGKINIIPEGWKNSYFSWMENIKDWCISRQIWWGHRIPVWYCADCATDSGHSQGQFIHVKLLKEINGIAEGTYAELKAFGFSHAEIISNAKTITVGIQVRPFSDRQDLNKCPQCGSAAIVKDPDVLDTWFSSALWPFSTLGWPDNTDDLKTFYPTSVLVTGFDILFFWVARMIMMGQKFMKDVPFHDVYIHALVRDEKGQKMSKSKGNVVDPLTIIDNYGTDSFRFSLAAFAAQGRDIKFAEERVEGYRRFANKLWNASRFIKLNIDKIEPAGISTIGEISEEIQALNKGSLTLPDKWILYRLSEAASDIDKALADYRFNDASSAVYQFVWHELCDWYIELAKTSFERNYPNASLTLKCLIYVFDNSLRLLHPFMPFITEELWKSFPQTGQTISLAPYPAADMFRAYANANDEMSFVIDAISGIRSIRGEFNISPSKKLKVSVKTSGKIRKMLIDNSDFIVDLAKLETLETGSNIEKKPSTMTAVKTGMEIYVSVSGLFDVAAEFQRLGKELKKLDTAIRDIEVKLSNMDYRDRAPKAIVEKDKLKYSELIEKRDRIQSNIDKLKKLDK